jgi:hypothetical protein
MGVHLVVLHHGLWGHPAHLDYLATKLTATLSNVHPPLLSSKAAEAKEGGGEGSPEQGSKEGTPDTEVLVHNCTANAGDGTVDGIDLCGDRVVLELQGLPLWPEVTAISFIGYSLGGLVLR